MTEARQSSLPVSVQTDCGPLGILLSGYCGHLSQAYEADRFPLLVSRLKD